MMVLCQENGQYKKEGLLGTIDPATGCRGYSWMDNRRKPKN